MHLPANNRLAEHVQHHVQAHELPFDRAGQVRDVPAPDLVGPLSHPCLGRGHFLGQLRFASAVELAVLFEHPVKARLRGQVQPSVYQVGHDLRGRQTGVLRGIAHLHNRLLFFRRERSRGWMGTGFEHDPYNQGR